MTDRPALPSHRAARPARLTVAARLPLAAMLSALPLAGLAGCTQGKDSAATDDTGATSGAAWQAIGTGLPSAVLSVGGTAADDVWMVGADNGAGPYVLRWDGAAWSQIDTGTTGDLWWVRKIGDRVYMAGAGGRVYVYDPAAGTGAETVLDETVTFYGIWGSSEQDIWAVGGKPEAGSDGGTVYHWDGAAWSLAAIPAEASAAMAIFKVNGSAAGDVWAVGSGGVAIHWDGAAWSLAGGTGTRNLFTVHGKDGVYYAVGGFSTGTILRYDGSAWADETPELAPQLNGVHALSADIALATGNTGAIWLRDADGWREDTRHKPLFEDFHSAWADPDGGFWASGGHLSSRPLDGGMLYYYGWNPPATIGE